MPPPLLFDRTLLRRRRRDAACDFLLREMEARLAERAEETGGAGGAELHLSYAGAHARALSVSVRVDEECLPFAEGAFNLITSCAGLHWVNDLPGALTQIHRLLKPGGRFIAIFPGGETLRELRDAVAEASAAVEEGLAARISPFVDVRDAGALLARAGFAEPVADSEALTVSYADSQALMLDLCRMGEANALAARSRRFMKRGLPQAIAHAYHARHGDAEGRIPATFELIGMTGWKR